MSCVLALTMLSELQSDSETLALFGADGAVTLYHDNAGKLATKSDGIDVTGEVQCDSLDVDGNADITGNLTLHANLDMQDNDTILLGTGDDFRFYHTGYTSYILNLTGTVFIDNNANDQDIVLRTDNGSGSITTYLACDGSTGRVFLFYYGAEKFSTKSNGVNVIGELECDSLNCDGGADIAGDTNFHGNVDLQDNDHLRLGSSDDLQLVHNASNSHIQNYTGGFYIDQNLNDGDIALRSDNGNGGLSNYIVCDGSDGKVRLYHYGSEKLQTASWGIDVTGEVQCDSLDVDGTSDFSARAMFNNCASNNHDDMANSAGSLGAFEVYNSGAGNDAFFAFHTGSDFACYFGLDADSNDLAVGGWSMGAVKHKVWHAGNDGSGSGLDADLVDGLQASSFLRSDTADTASGDITFSGGAGAARIAANSDIRLESGSWTGEVGTGACKIQSHSNHLYFQSHSSFIFRNGAANDRLVIDNGGNLVADGNVTAYSDIRLKKDIEVIPHALDKVLSLRGVNYTNIESGDRRTGVIAQEVQAVLPEAVQENEEYLSWPTATSWVC